METLSPFDVGQLGTAYELLRLEPHPYVEAGAAYGAAAEPVQLPLGGVHGAGQAVKQGFDAVGRGFAGISGGNEMDPFKKSFGKCR